MFTRPLKPTSSPAPSHADVYQTGNAVPPWWWFMTCILEPLWPIKCQERVWSSHQTFLKRTAASSKWLQSIQRSNSSKTFPLISREAVVRSSKWLCQVPGSFSVFWFPARDVNKITYECDHIQRNYLKTNQPHCLNSLRKLLKLNHFFFVFHRFCVVNSQNYKQFCATKGKKYVLFYLIITPRLISEIPSTSLTIIIITYGDFIFF